MQPPRHRFPREETMAKSHQRGTLRLENNSWVGYFNLKVRDPITGETKWKKQRVGVLGTKSKMTKHQAHPTKQPEGAPTEFCGLLAAHDYVQRKERPCPRSVQFAPAFLPPAFC